MAQAKTVEIPTRLPLVTVQGNRNNDPTKDSKLVNCYAEKQQSGDYYIYKRPGLLADSQPPVGAATGRGIYRWLGDTYSVFGNKLYKNGVAITGTVDTTNGVYRFSSCRGTAKLQLGNGVKAYNYDSANGLVLINDADFPASFVKGWGYLDGTIYVMVPTTRHIQGSAIEDPTSWDPTNTITAQIQPDQGIALATQLVYVIAFKEWSTEVFYDQQNATGSPLGPVQGAKINFGCINADSVRDIDGVLFWLSTNRVGAAQIMIMDNLKVQTISTPAIERLIDDSTYATVYSWTHKDEGHKFYVITLVDINLTLAYDIGQQLWSQWTDSNGNYLPIVDSCADGTLEHLVQHASNGYLYKIDTEYFNDNGAIITADIVTPNYDGGIDRRKMCNRLRIDADQTPGSILLERHNDNDYNPTTWTNFRRIDLSYERPALSDMGTFVRRAHNFRHQSNTRMRIKAIDLQIDIGTL